MPSIQLDLLLVLAAFAKGDNTSFNTLTDIKGVLDCKILSIEVLPLIASFTFTPESTRSTIFLAVALSN